MQSARKNAATPAPGRAAGQSARRPDPLLSLAAPLAGVRLDRGKVDRQREQAQAVARTLAAIGHLRASRNRDVTWLGQALAAWLFRGADLARELGVEAAPRSRRTAALLLRMDDHASALLRLSDAAGSDAHALRLMRGHARPATPAQRMALDEVREIGAPCSGAAFTRARDRLGLSRRGAVVTTPHSSAIEPHPWS